ncbi:MAG: hypothetical protein ABW220_01485 [Burkholderiaceae bacterium]
MRWNTREYLQRRREFIAQRGHNHPMLTATTLIFTATWLFAWGMSALLLHAGMHSMPKRYALSFLASYGVFFLCVRLWCNSVHNDRQRSDSSGGFDLGSGDEGCFVVLAIAFAAFLVAVLFWATGGVAALLEVAFEVAFAGTVVRGLSRTEIVGHWARTLFAHTWPHALVVLVVLVSIAIALQHAAPEATTFSQAFKAIRAKP